MSGEDALQPLKFENPVNWIKSGITENGFAIGIIRKLKDLNGSGDTCSLNFDFMVERQGLSDVGLNAQDAFAFKTEVKNHFLKSFRKAVETWAKEGEAKLTKLRGAAASASGKIATSFQKGKMTEAARDTEARKVQAALDKEVEKLQNNMESAMKSKVELLGKKSFDAVIAIYHKKLKLDWKKIRSISFNFTMAVVLIAIVAVAVLLTASTMGVGGIAAGAAAGIAAAAAATPTAVGLTIVGVYLAAKTWDAVKNAWKGFSASSAAFRTNLQHFEQGLKDVETATKAALKVIPKFEAARTALIGDYTKLKETLRKCETELAKGASEKKVKELQKKITEHRAQLARMEALMRTDLNAYKAHLEDSLALLARKDETNKNQWTLLRTIQEAAKNFADLAGDITVA